MKTIEFASAMKAFSCFLLFMSSITYKAWAEENKMPVVVTLMDQRLEAPIYKLDATVSRWDSADGKSIGVPLELKISNSSQEKVSIKNPLDGLVMTIEGGMLKAPLTIASLQYLVNNKSGTPTPRPYEVRAVKIVENKLSKDLDSNSATLEIPPLSVYVVDLIIKEIRIPSSKLPEKIGQGKYNIRFKLPLISVPEMSSRTLIGNVSIDVEGVK